MSQIVYSFLAIFTFSFSLLNASTERSSPLHDTVQYDADSPQYTDAGLPKTDPEYIGFLYQILKVLDIEFSKNGIPYWIDFGSLLGAKRHGGIIPWDDDIDITIMIDDIHKVRNLTHIFQSWGLILKQRHPQPWKLFRPGNPYCCVDIFFIFKFPVPSEKKLWYECDWTGFWYEDEVCVLERIPFGPLQVSAPSNWMRRIYEQYGSDCMEKAFFHSHTHPHIAGTFIIDNFSPAEYIVDPNDMIISLDD